MKTCEICATQIPDDFVNLLCLSCYSKIDEENKQKAADAEEDKQTHEQAFIEKKEQPQTPPFSPPSPQVVQGTQAVSKFGITDPNYKENPEQPDKDQVLTNLAQFGRTGDLLWPITRKMYEYIKTWSLDQVTKHPQYPKFIWKPEIVDVGCGCGVGSNIMSQEASFVWGIDKNSKSISFARQAFERVKNGIYYSAQVTFDEVDIMSDTRNFKTFDVVVAIEVIEHIYDTHTFLANIINKFARRNKDGTYDQEQPTTYFISTPNRNSPTILKDHPKNRYHVREWTAEEFATLLGQYFNEGKLYNHNGQQVEVGTLDTPIFAVCRHPKI